ncbi:MAG: type II secretion system protein GspH [Gammaproteobacteria bacterium RIFCSPLOWO2_02_FULL_56_15]|nr:MAG: type II secretion system protein GspH [Gammaproteobacteria bacterium RIFCSPLOWO2_02_FULL_56_15]
MYPSTGSRAFTLVELLVVLAIASLVLALIPPLLDNILPENRVRGAARNLATELKLSRSLAIRSHEETVLILDVEQQYYVSANAEHGLNLPQDTVLTLTTAESESLSENRGSIRFFPDGSSTGGQIHLHYRQGEYVVDVNWLTGQVSLLW